jgi:hypothetical protein
MGIRGLVPAFDEWRGHCLQTVSVVTAAAECGVWCGMHGGGGPTGGEAPAHVTKPFAA